MLSEQIVVISAAQDGQAVLLVLRDNQMYRYTEWRFQQDWAPALGGEPGTKVLATPYP